jgi:hypothetical protein
MAAVVSICLSRDDEEVIVFATRTATKPIMSEGRKQQSSGSEQSR